MQHKHLLYSLDRVSVQLVHVLAVLALACCVDLCLNDIITFVSAFWFVVTFYFSHRLSSSTLWCILLFVQLHGVPMQFSFKLTHLSNALFVIIGTRLSRVRLRDVATQGRTVLEALKADLALVRQVWVLCVLVILTWNWGRDYHRIFFSDLFWNCIWLIFWYRLFCSRFKFVFCLCWLIVRFSQFLACLFIFWR